MEQTLGPWSPLSLDEAVTRFEAASFPWWISGGHALELYTARSWRAHDDMDVSFRRSDASGVYTLLADWDVHIAAAGVLYPWSGEALSVELHHNNLWARPNESAPWCLDLTVSDGDDHEWVFRRDPAVRRPWADAVLRSTTGIPYLAPELQLLFKAKNRRPKDDVDAAAVIPLLTSDQTDFLFSLLPSNDPWTELRK